MKKRVFRGRRYIKVEEPVKEEMVKVEEVKEVKEEPKTTTKTTKKAK